MPHTVDCPARLAPCPWGGASFRRLISAGRGALPQRCPLGLQPLPTALLSRNLAQPALCRTLSSEETPPICAAPMGTTSHMWLLSSAVWPGAVRKWIFNFQSNSLRGVVALVLEV